MELQSRVAYNDLRYSKDSYPSVYKRSPHFLGLFHLACHSSGELKTSSLTDTIDPSLLVGDQVLDLDEVYPDNVIETEGLGHSRGSPRLWLSAGFAFFT